MALPPPPATALLTTGSASAPSVAAAAIITIAIVMPVMPVMPAIAPANAVRASCTEPRSVASALPSTVRIVPANRKKAKPASRIRKPPILLFHWLSSAHVVQS